MIYPQRSILYDFRYNDKIDDDLWGIFKEFARREINIYKPMYASVNERATLGDKYR